MPVNPCGCSTTGKPGVPEVDLLVQSERGWIVAEAKSGSTVDASFFSGMETFATRLPKATPIVRRLVYGGSESQKRQGVAVTAMGEDSG
jgi:hypothetical protein